MMSGDLGRENVVFRQWLWYNESTGVLAQLIRALRWQRRGHEFESRTLHQVEIIQNIFCNTLQKIFLFRNERSE